MASADFNVCDCGSRLNAFSMAVGRGNVDGIIDDTGGPKRSSPTVAVSIGGVAGEWSPLSKPIPEAARRLEKAVTGGSRVSVRLPDSSNIALRFIKCALKGGFSEASGSLIGEPFDGSND